MSFASPPLRFPRRLPFDSDMPRPRAEELESMASLLEDLLPIFQSEDERQFYQEVVESYRAAAREILQAS